MGIQTVAGLHVHDPTDFPIFSKASSASGNYSIVGTRVEGAMGVSSRELLGFLTRLRAAPAADSDAALLERFVRTSENAAFTELVHRHGPMVWAVCRRRLGHTADAEDAFQAVFLALARSAHSIHQRVPLPGWLYRVAYLVALKAAGRRARHLPPTPLTNEVPVLDSTPPAWETAELKALIDAEVATLTDKFRAVVVLCLIEGRTREDAAAVLGVPVGTVSSRLNAARKKLQARLIRRGVAFGVGVTLEQLLGGPVEAAGPKVVELVSRTITAVLSETTGSGTGAISPAVLDLARGITTMTTTKFRLLATLLVVLGLVGSAGVGIFFATAADPTRPVARTTNQPPAVEPTTPGDAPAPPATKTEPTTPNNAPPATKTEPGRKGPAALLQPLGWQISGSVQVQDLFAMIEDKTDLIVRVDLAAFQRIGAVGRDQDELGDGVKDFLNQVRFTKVTLPRKVEKLPIRDVLADALAQVSFPRYCPLTYQIRGSQLVIIPAYVPPVRPGRNPLALIDDETALVTESVLSEQIYGGVVNVTADQKPLTEILADLQTQTGANIVVDPRSEAQARKVELTIKLNDVRLYDALRVITDMAELKMVYAGNIYYVTTPANAQLFQPATPRPPARIAPPPPVAPALAPKSGK